MADNEIKKPQQEENLGLFSSNETKAKKESKKREQKCLKAMYKVSVYSPVITVLFLSILIYCSYIVGYVYILITYPSEAAIDKIYPFYPHFFNTKISSYSKGMFLLVFTSICLFMFTIAYIRTVFMDPGYVEDPSKYEINIIESAASVCKNSECQEDLNEVRKRRNLPVNPNEKFNGLLNEGFRFGPASETEAIDYSKLLESYYISPSALNDNSEQEVGQVEESIMVKSEESSNQVDAFQNYWAKFKNEDLIKLALCSSCFRFKIERAHHCRQCGQCVLKMDHHCPWLANCIGFRNYKYFCLIHIYGSLLGLTVTLTFWEAVAGVLWNSDSLFLECFIYLFAYICNLGLTAFLIWLFACNFKLVFTAHTVIEQSDRVRFPSVKYRHPYDIGYYGNFTSVFGTNPLVWFLPFFANYEGEGVVYQKYQGFEVSKKTNK